MEEMIFGGQPQKHSVWDEYTPIIQEGRHTDVYLADQIEAPSEYNKLCHILRKAFKGDTVTLHINNGGGFLDGAFAILDAINTTQAIVTAQIVGTVASASTIITLACHHVVLAEHLQFMIHNYSGGASGKGHEIKSQMEFTDSQLNKSFAIFYKGFLTENEMELVIAGKDYWMGTEEVRDRLAARKAKDSDRLEEIAAARKAK